VIEPLYVAARGVLLDALDALGEQREALILAGAQAIYIHTGAADLAVAEFTTDGDLVVNPEQLKAQPRLSEAMERALFRSGLQPGSWLCDRTVSGIATTIPSTCSCRRLWRAQGAELRVLAITVIAPAGGFGAWRVH
jgi:hypothetical protein